MDFIRLLDSFEDLVSEIVVWALMLPKTLWHAIVRPDWIHGYIDEELAKPPDKRFNDHFPPILFWLIVGLSPYILIRVGESLPGVPVSFGLASTSFQIASLIIALVFPLVFIWVLNRVMHQPIEKEGLKRLLLAQCYMTAPVLLLEAFGSVTLYAYISNPADQVSLFIGAGLMAMALIWIILRETGLFMQEGVEPRGRALGAVIGACLLRIPLSLVISALAVQVISATVVTS